MMIFDNIFVIWGIELFTIIYIYHAANNNLLGEDNLYKKWTNRVKLTNENDPNVDGYFQSIFKNLAGNIFKKTPDGLGSKAAPIVKDDFSQFVSDIVFSLQTFFFIIAIATLLYFTSKIFKRLFNKFFSQTSHLSPPNTFEPYSKQPIRRWLDDMNRFFEAANITKDSEKCAIVLSKCNDTTKRSLLAFDKTCKKSYSSIVHALTRMYKEHSKSTEEFYKMFSSLTQTSCGTINDFYIELEEIADLAFPNVTDENKMEIIEKRFIDGITNEHLRAAIKLAKQKAPTWFESNFKRQKSILEIALELNEIYEPKDSKINYTQYSKAGPKTLCYRCSNYGHFGRDCPLNNQSNETTNTSNSINNQNQRKNQSSPQNQSSQSNGITHNQKVNQTVTLRAVDYSDSITGWCKVDDKFVRFMADTGASKTVIDYKLLDSKQTSNLKDTNFKVKLADGSLASVKGLLDCIISLNNKPINIEILVIENLPEGCLLGYDFLKCHPMTKVAISDLKQVITSSNENQVSISSVEKFEQTSNSSE
jgi:predicted aspartyl protease